MIKNVLPDFDPLREQLLVAASQFTAEAQPVNELLTRIVCDIELGPCPER